MPEGEYKPTSNLGVINGEPVRTSSELPGQGGAHEGNEVQQDPTDSPKHSAEAAAAPTTVLPKLGEDGHPVGQETPGANASSEQSGIDNKTVELEQPNIPPPDTTAQTGIQYATVIGTAPVTTQEGTVAPASSINTAAPTEELPKLDEKGGRHRRQNPVVAWIKNLLPGGKEKPTEAVLKVENTAVRGQIPTRQTEPVDAELVKEPVGANK